MDSTKLDIAATTVGQLKPHQLFLTLGLGVIVLGALLKAFLFPDTKSPPMLRDIIPYVSNTYQFITKMDKFLARVAKPLKENKVVGFYLGFRRVFFVTGDEGIQSVTKTSPHVGFEPLVLLALENMMGFTPEDLAKFSSDKSGRLMAAPNPGTEHTPEIKRYWARFHEITHKYLTNMHYANGLALKYRDHFDEWVVECYEKQLAEHQRPENLKVTTTGDQGWVEMRLMECLKTGLGTASTRTLMGHRVFELIPDLIKRLWDFDSIAATLALGPKPKWLFRDVYAKGEAFTTATQRYYEQAIKELGLDDSHAPVDNDAVDWEPLFGSRYSRELIAYLRTSELDSRSAGGMLAIMGLAAVNLNVIPVTAWGLMEMARDPELRRLIREEVESTAINTDPQTGSRRIDIQKVTGLPRLTSLYLELLRAHLNVNLLREIVQPGFQIAGYPLPQGSFIVGNTGLVQHDEAIWGRSDSAGQYHPASEFWAERHLEYVDNSDVNPSEGVDATSRIGSKEHEKQQQVLRVKMPRPTEWIPFGGGVTMCPGRHFAKQEIMLTLATFATRFEVEFVEWLNTDGTKSSRPAMHDLRCTGVAAMPPDREMKVRWRRRW